MTDTAPTHATYDAMGYWATPKPTASPENLHAASVLYGFDSPDTETCSYLELGCSDGLNVIAFASAHPRARCVGMDLSVEAIARGNALLADLGLTNCELVHADIMTYPLEGETFDYIGAHGVLAWVPEPVRPAIFRLLGARLSPNGIGYLGYDTLPASAAKAAIMGYINPLIAHFDDLDRRVDAFMSIVRILLSSQQANSQLKEGLEFILRVSRGLTSKNYFFHDFLEPFYRPMPIDEVSALATAHGVKLVGDATLHERLPELEGEAMRLLQLVGRDYVSFSKTLAFLRGDRTFRSDMLARTGAAELADEAADDRLRFAFDGVRVEEEGGIVAYKYSEGAARLPATETAKLAVLDHLVSVCPHEASLAEIVELTGVDRTTAAGVLRSAAGAGVLELVASPEPFAYAAGERPLTTALNRVLAQRDNWVVSLRQVKVELDDDRSRMLMSLCDGTHTHAELADILAEKTGERVTVEQVTQNLKVAARRRLLIA